MKLFTLSFEYDCFGDHKALVGVFDSKELNDLNRERSVGSKVIMDMYYKYLYKPAESVQDIPGLPSCILVDIDGTIAERVDRGPFEWSKVGQDKVRKHVLDVIHSVAKSYEDVHLILLSGRDSVCARETCQWIKKNNVLIGKEVTHPTYRSESVLNHLYMRPQGDSRPDYIVKEELYRTHIEGKYNVSAIFDDRDQVCRMWDRIGLGDRLFRVGPVDRSDF